MVMLFGAIRSECSSIQIAENLEGVFYRRLHPDTKYDCIAEFIHRQHRGSQGCFAFYCYVGKHDVITSSAYLKCSINHEVELFRIKGSMNNAINLARCWAKCDQMVRTSSRFLLFPTLTRRELAGCRKDGIDDIGCIAIVNKAIEHHRIFSSYRSIDDHDSCRDVIKQWSQDLEKQLEKQIEMIQT